MSTKSGQLHTRDALSERASSTSAEDEPLCDVLSVQESSADLAEVLLQADASLNAAQILEIRRRLLAYAKERGWAED